MPFDEDMFGSAATRGDVAGVALQMSIALSHLRLALTKIKYGKIEEITEEVDGLDEVGKNLDEMFNTLTGWTR